MKTFFKTSYFRTPSINRIQQFDFQTIKIKKIADKLKLKNI